MIVDQAQALRSLVEQSGYDEQAEVSDEVAERTGAHVIAVTSGKGGVGKSNVAVNLSIALAQRGKQVVLLDADLGTANIDVLCNIEPRATLSHVVSGRSRLEDALIQTPGGFGLVAGASGLAQIAEMTRAERDRLIEQLHMMEVETDYIIIDTGAGVSSNVLGFALGADEILVVTTPEPTAVTDAYAVMKTLAKRTTELNIRVLINMARNEAEGKQVFDRIDMVSRRFLDLEPAYAGCLPYDSAVSASVRARVPFMLRAGNSQVAKGVVRLASQFDRVRRGPSQCGLFGRMASWLSLK